jgi:hypothetical protein
MMGKTIAVGGKPETVNDFLPGDPGSAAGRRLPAMQAPAEESLPYGGNLEIAGTTLADPPVTLPASVVRLLVLASDVVRGNAKTIIGDTPATVGIDTLELLAGAGLIDEDTLEPTEAFEVALAIAGQAVGIATIDPFAADVEVAERLVVGGATLPAAGSFSAG